MYNFLYAKNIERTKHYLDIGTDPNSKNDKGETALMLAKFMNQTRLLISAGADLNSKDNLGQNTLIYAITSGQIDRFKLFIRSANNKHLYVNNKDINGKTALMHLIQLPNNSNWIEFMLKNGADVNIVDNNGNTALMYNKFIAKICRRGFSCFCRSNISSGEKYKDVIEKTKILIGANGNINIKNNCGKTVLIDSGSIEQTRLFLEAGADPDIQDENGNTALICLNSINPNNLLVEAMTIGLDLNSSRIISKYVELTKLLLEAGANPNIQNKNGDTALMLSKSAEQSQVLLEAGANPNIQNMNGDTALMKSKSAEQTRCLLSAGAVFDTRNNNNRSAFSFIVHRKNIFRSIRKRERERARRYEDYTGWESDYYESDYSDDISGPDETHKQLEILREIEKTK